MKRDVSPGRLPVRPLATLLLCAAALGGLLGLRLAAQGGGAPAIHFSFRAIDFTLDSCESPRRHAPETMAGGLAVFDYDNDGHSDIFFTNGADIYTLKKSAAKYRNRLFRNDGKGNFTDVTDKAGLAGEGYDNGVAAGDYDNDGYTDLFVGGLHRNTLYHNNGDGTFTDVTARAGLSAPDKEHGPLWSVGGAWLDVNNDGLLDLFVLNYLSWTVPTERPCIFQNKPEYCHPKFYKETPNQLFLNKGDGTFADISVPSGVRAHPGKGMGAGIADVDGDGLLDIFVSNDKLFNFLFRNRGKARFQEAAFESGVALPDNANLISGMGVDVRDLNNDGHPDIVLVALDNETFPVYLNTGKGDFEEVTARSGMTMLSTPMAGYSPNIGDFDNDGWKDVFVSRGHVQSPAMADRLQINQINSVFRNSPEGRWSALTEQAGFGEQPPRRHRGAALGDFNGDGRLDVAVSALSAPAEIWMNDSPGGHHWVGLMLEGTKSNRSAIGARVRVTAGGRTQFDHVSTASGYASSSARPLYFGLAGATVAEEIEIRWPSGAVQTVKNLATDRVHRIKE